LRVINCRGLRKGEITGKVEKLKWERFYLFTKMSLNVFALELFWTQVYTFHKSIEAIRKPSGKKPMGIKSSHLILIRMYQYSKSLHSFLKLFFSL